MPEQGGCRVPWAQPGSETASALTSELRPLQPLSGQLCARALPPLPRRSCSPLLNGPSLARGGVGAGPTRRVRRSAGPGLTASGTRFRSAAAAYRPTYHAPAASRPPLTTWRGSSSSLWPRGVAVRVFEPRFRHLPSASALSGAARRDAPGKTQHGRPGRAPSAV